MQWYYRNQRSGGLEDCSAHRIRNEGCCGTVPEGPRAEDSPYLLFVSRIRIFGEGTAEAAVQGEFIALGPPAWNAGETLACDCADRTRGVRSTRFAGGLKAGKLPPLAAESGSVRLFLARERRTRGEGRQDGGAEGGRGTGGRGTVPIYQSIKGRRAVVQPLTFCNWQRNRSLLHSSRDAYSVALTNRRTSSWACAQSTELILSSRRARHHCEST